MHVAFDVAGLVVVEPQGIAGARRGGAEVGGKLFVFDFDQVESLGRGLNVDGGDGGHWLATVPHPLLGERMLVHGDGQDAVGGGDVGTGDDGPDACQPLGLGGVDSLDTGMSRRAPTYAAHERLPEAVVGGESGPSTDFVGAVHERHGYADRGGNRPGFVHLPNSAAAAWTAAMIFT